MDAPMQVRKLMGAHVGIGVGLSMSVMGVRMGVLIVAMCLIEWSTVLVCCMMGYNCDTRTVHHR